MIAEEQSFAMREHRLTRRQALGRLGSIAAPVRLAPREQLVNILEYEDQAKRKLKPDVCALIAGGDRSAFDRITLRPRMLVPTLDMDLGVTLFGEALFAPIIVGPIAHQTQFHPDGELETVKGASAAKAVMVVSSHSSVSLPAVVAQAETPLWYQVFASDAAAKIQIQDAVKAGCKAICVTVGAAPAVKGARAIMAAKVDWAAIEALKQRVNVPVLVKGIATLEDAKLALGHNVQGIIVSNYGGLVGPSKDALILKLPTIVDAVAGKVPVLVDGSFRRGTDILKALAFGAQSVLVGRPAMWGLAAYGADGVQGVIEMLQTELARYMGLCGKSSLKMLDRTILHVHDV